MRKNNDKDVIAMEQNDVIATEGGADDVSLKPAQPNDNTRFINHAVEIYKLPPIEIGDAQAVEERLSQYFDICARNGMKPNIAGLASALGISRQYIWEIANNKTNVSQKVVYTIKKAQQLINQMMEDYMMAGKINPVSAIFLMKNNMGYKDQQEVVLSPNMPEKNNEDLINESKYLTIANEDGAKTRR